MTMDRSEIVRRTNAAMAKEFELDPARLTPEADLYEDLQLDSLDSVDMVAALEREFGVVINRQADETALRSIRKMDDVYAFVAGKL